MYRLYLYWDAKKLILPYYIEVDDLPRKIRVSTSRSHYNADWCDIKAYKFTELGNLYPILVLENPQLSYMLKSKKPKVYVDTDIPLPEGLPEWIKLY